VAEADAVGAGSSVAPPASNSLPTGSPTTTQAAQSNLATPSLPVSSPGTTGSGGGGSALAPGASPLAPGATPTEATHLLASPTGCASVVAAGSGNSADGAVLPLRPLSLASLRWRPPRRVRMRVSVKDSGRGLSATELPLLFEPYVQFKSGEQQQGKGTGLGLNISKSLVELHGGTIGVASTGVPGEGCEFWFEVPLEVVPASESRTRSAQNSPPQHAPASASRSASLRRHRTSQDFSAQLLQSPHAQQQQSLSQLFAAESAGAGANAGRDGLRIWHSPRTAGRTLAAAAAAAAAATGGVAPQSQQGSPSMHGRRFGSLAPSNSGVFSNSSHATSSSLGGGLVTSAAAELAATRFAAQLQAESDSQWPELYQSSSSSSSSAAFSTNSTATTPTLMQRVLIARGLDANVGSGAAGPTAAVAVTSPSSLGLLHPPSSSTNNSSSLQVERASLVPIVPQGGDTKSSLQYMSQLSFLNELAIQGHHVSSSASPPGSAASAVAAGARTLPGGTSSYHARNRSRSSLLGAPRSGHGSGSASLRTSPLQKYRAHVLSSIPYGVGYDQQNSSVASLFTPPEAGSSSSQAALAASLVAAESDASLPRALTSMNPLPASTPASSPLQQPGVLLAQRAASNGTAAPSAVTVGAAGAPAAPVSSSGADASAAGVRSSLLSPETPIALEQGAQPGVFSTSPFMQAQRQLYDMGDNQQAANAVGASGGVAGTPLVSPLASSVAPVDSPAAAAAAASPAAKPRPRILVVEDSVPNRKLLVMLLRALKCDAVGVEDGLQAVAEFDEAAGASLEALQARLKQRSSDPHANHPQSKGSQYALVLIDGNMPVLDGIEATKAIRALGWRVPIVAVTGNALTEDTENFLEAGADFLLAKPVQRAALEQVLLNFIPGFESTHSVAQVAIAKARQNANKGIPQS